MQSPLSKKAVVKLIQLPHLILLQPANRPSFGKREAELRQAHKQHRTRVSSQSGARPHANWSTWWSRPDGKGSNTVQPTGPALLSPPQAAHPHINKQKQTRETARRGTAGRGEPLPGSPGVPSSSTAAPRAGSAQRGSGSGLPAARGQGLQRPPRRPAVAPQGLPAPQDPALGPAPHGPRVPPGGLGPAQPHWIVDPGLAGRNEAQHVCPTEPPAASPPS